MTDDEVKWCSTARLQRGQTVIVVDLVIDLSSVGYTSCDMSVGDAED
jgi:hypothetical protein